jgi:hypothetical protein
MPRLRGLLPECDGDGRFWCKPLERRATSGALPAEYQPSRHPEHA